MPIMRRTVSGLKAVHEPVLVTVQHLEGGNGSSPLESAVCNSSAEIAPLLSLSTLL